MTAWSTDLLDDWTLKNKSKQCISSGYIYDDINNLRKKLIEDFSDCQGSSINKKIINYRFGIL